MKKRKMGWSTGWTRFCSPNISAKNSPSSQALPLNGTYGFLWGALATIFLFGSCGSTKELDTKTILYTDTLANTVTVEHSSIPKPIKKKVVLMDTTGPAITDTVRFAGPAAKLRPQYPMAQRLVDNYVNSKNKNPGGHCLTASKSRILQAYEDVYHKSIYEALPDSIATAHYNPEQVFDHLYATTSGTHKGWRSLPKKYRGKGSAGALAQAGMGKLVSGREIWKGELRPGSPMQVWRHKKDYKKVVRGSDDPNLDPFGHSFIFLGYVWDTQGQIIGIKIADQGYQSNRTLTPRDYAVWWGVNLEV
ncbi:hypothetical protein [Maribacter sp. 2307ULW6-5]|uniref:hypothetical protein n=1 Tax=Maribacter sp. 2307ULW6-5 TaxID=3386275 RepID=UPI0039BC9160